MCLKETGMLRDRTNEQQEARTNRRAGTFYFACVAALCVKLGIPKRRENVSLRNISVKIK